MSDIIVHNVRCDICDDHCNYLAASGGDRICLDCAEHDDGVAECEDMAELIRGHGNDDCAECRALVAT